MAQKLNENTCNTFVYIVKRIGILVGECLQIMLVEIVSVVLKYIYKNFTYRILKINIGKPKSNVEYIVHTYEVNRKDKEVGICYLKK
ncbi:hypothetical protein BACERE00177_05007 [Bacillus mobilis]|nr:hypothetical protein BJR06_10725 [Bacillus cereus]SME49478.1 hypothetical protein BACERE00177_05007 [Bacillus mobilis]